MSLWDRTSREEFRLELAYAYGNEINPLDVVGRQWREDDD